MVEEVVDQTVGRVLPHMTAEMVAQCLSVDEVGHSAPAPVVVVEGFVGGGLARLTTTPLPTIANLMMTGVTVIGITKGAKALGPGRGTRDPDLVVDPDRDPDDGRFRGLDPVLGVGTGLGVLVQGPDLDPAPQVDRDTGRRQCQSRLLALSCR